MKILSASLLIVFTTVLLSCANTAKKEEKPVTCTWVKSHNTYYCEAGTFDDLVADCLTTSDTEACCVVTGDPDICSSSQSDQMSVKDILNRAIDERNAITFSRTQKNLRMKMKSKMNETKQGNHE
ncbi:MAG: hypothetical protein P8010_00365 [Desulfosarcinaceae bacterium]